jgi:hypothetical protein
LNELHGKAADGGQQKSVHKTAFVQQDLLDKPDDKKE